MMTKVLRSMLIVGWASMIGLGGCEDEAGMTSQNVCVPGAATCKDAHTSSVCAADGLSKVDVACRGFEACAEGACKPDPNVACTDAQNTCIDATTAIRCSASKWGFEVATCPTGTTCDRGQCRGACVVGLSFCDGIDAVVSCDDGLGFKHTPCGEGQNCVYQQGTGQSEEGYAEHSDDARAACKPSACRPQNEYCAQRQCGNLASPAAPDQDKTFSTCLATPDGYKWAPTSCTGGATCNPSVTTCGGVPVAGCAVECKAGDQRCSDALHQVTCGTDGKWGTPTACNASATAVTLVCFNDATHAGKVLCGDLACQGGVGACDDAGLFHACGADGKLAAAGTACATGVCQADGTGGISPWPAGRCKAQCVAGEERCLGGGTSSSYQVCAANGTWGVVQNCASGAACSQLYIGNPVLRKKACGAGCATGMSRCSDDTGVAVASGKDHYIQSCDVDGNWAAPTSCVAGDCFADPAQPGLVGCIAACVPGKKICMGSDATVATTDYLGTTEEGVCTAEGRRPDAGTACAASTYCRKNAAGQSVGCVTCIGGLNEFGLPDTRCAAADKVEQCLADGSAWDTAGALTCAAPADTCTPASVNVQPPKNTGTYCHFHPGWLPSTEYPVRDSFLKGWGPQESCQDNQFNQDYGPPVPCALRDGGMVGDCCAKYCIADPQPTSAYCRD